MNKELLLEEENQKLKDEFKKLEDLDFEYHLLEAQCEDKLQVAVAKAKYNNQLKKFEKLVDDVQRITNT